MNKPANSFTVPAPSVRNPFASHAAGRKAGAMKHKAAGRGGQRNAQRDLLDEWYAEIDDETGAVEVTP